MAMLIMQYAANRPAFMGNPNHETDELLRIHHAVPALCMNGYGTKPLEYKLWAFTGQGFGGKLQVDLHRTKTIILHLVVSIRQVIPCALRKEK